MTQIGCGRSHPMDSAQDMECSRIIKLDQVAIPRLEL